MADIGLFLFKEVKTVDFFDKTVCDRCGKKLTARIMSVFNTDTICLDCKRKEEAHPMYSHARQAEYESIKRGDMNFPGIGLPPDLR